MRDNRFLLLLTVTLLVSVSNASQDNQEIIKRTEGSPFCFGIVMSPDHPMDKGVDKRVHPIGEIHAYLPYSYHASFQDNQQIVASHGPLELISNGNVHLKLNNTTVGFNVADILIGIYRTIKNTITCSKISTAFVDKYAQWRKEDYRNDIVEKFRKADPTLSYDSFRSTSLRNNCFSEDIQKAILCTYDQYQFAEFREFIKTLPLYKSHINQLYKRVMDEAANAPGWFAVASGLKKPTSWAGYPGYEYQSFPSVVETLYADINKEITSAPITIDSTYSLTSMSSVAQKEAVAPSVTCATPQEEQVQEKQHIVERRLVIQKRVQDNAVYLYESINVQRQDGEATTLNKREVARWQIREHALEQSKQDNFKFEIIEYSLTQQTADLLKDSCIDNPMFNDFDKSMLQETITLGVISLDGSAIQHCLQQELMSILDQAAAARYTPIQNESIRLLTDTIAGMTHVATEYNRLGDVKKTTLLANFCWAILDVGIGIGEGVIDGLYNVADMVAHPKNTVVNTAYGIDAAARSAGTLLYEICDITKDCVVNRKTGIDRINRAHYNIKSIARELKSKIKKMTPREIARVATGAIVETILTKKCMSTMHHLYKGAQSQMVVMAQKIERGVSPQVAYAAGGIEVALATEAADSVAMFHKGDSINQTRSLLMSAKKGKKNIGHAGKSMSNSGVSKVETGKKIDWTQHGYRHVPQKGLTWPEIIRTTKHGDARYKLGVNIESLERFAWKNGISCTNRKDFKVMKFDYPIGATEGMETCYMRVEINANTLHGHPITEQRYKNYLKKCK